MTVLKCFTAAVDILIKLVRRFKELNRMKGTSEMLLCAKQFRSQKGLNIRIIFFVKNLIFSLELN